MIVIANPKKFWSFCDMCGKEMPSNRLSVHTVTLSTGDNDDSAEYEVELCDPDGEKLQRTLKDALYSQLTIKAIKFLDDWRE